MVGNPYDGDEMIYLGAAPTDPSMPDWPSGGIQGAMVFKKALSAQEIAQVAAATRPESSE